MLVPALLVAGLATAVDWTYVMEPPSEIQTSISSADTASLTSRTKSAAAVRFPPQQQHCAAKSQAPLSLMGLTMGSHYICNATSQSSCPIKLSNPRGSIAKSIIVESCLLKRSAIKYTLRIPEKGSPHSKDKYEEYML